MPTPPRDYFRPTIQSLLRPFVRPRAVTLSVGVRFDELGFGAIRRILSKDVDVERLLDIFTNLMKTCKMPRMPGTDSGTL